MAVMDVPVFESGSADEVWQVSEKLSELGIRNTIEKDELVTRIFVKIQEEGKAFDIIDEWLLKNTQE